MIQISSQQTQVGHVFEQLREREIVASNPEQPRQALPSALLNEDEQTASRDTMSHLTPEQVVKARIIDSLSSGERHTLSQRLINDYLSLSEQLSSNRYTDIQVLATNQRDEQTRLTISEQLYEFEQLDYSTTIELQNQHGQLQTLSLSLSYSRELDIQRTLSMTAAEFKDPLIVNLDNRAELFKDREQQFDIDADGQQDSIPQLNDGIWYLAQDRNHNGKIDDGTELFGAITGNGFAELSGQDANADGVLDNQDSAYVELSLWNGRNQLKGLDESGVRGILLNPSQTPFTFTDESGNPKARLRQTSVFVSDDNSLGAVHQVDFVV